MLVVLVASEREEKPAHTLLCWAPSKVATGTIFNALMHSLVSNLWPPAPVSRRSIN